MNETELERMVIRLLGDASSYRSMLSSAVEGTQAAAQQVMQLGQQIEGYAHNLESFVGAAMGGLASLGAMGVLRSALGSYMDMERGAIRLRAAIEAGGRSADELIPRYRELAATIAETTMTTRGEVMAMAQRLEMMGKSGDAAERIIQTSISLAAATGMPAQHLMNAVIAAEQGNMHMLQYMLRMRGVRDQTEIMARAQSMLAAGTRVATAESESLAGQFHHITEAGKQLVKQFGELVAEGIRPIVTWYRQGVGTFVGMNKDVKVLVLSVTALVALFVAMPGLIRTISFAINFATGGSLTMLALIVAAGVALGAWINSVGGVSRSWERVIEVLRSGRDAVLGWMNENKELVISVGLLAAGLLAAVLAWKLMGVAIGVVAFVMAALKVQKIASIALWLVWQGVVLAANVALLAFSVSMGVWNFIVATATGVGGAWTIGVLAAKAATWLFNVALTAMNALLLGGGLFAILGTFALLAPLVLVVGAAMYAAWETGAELFSILGDIPTQSGPLRVISDMFGEWYDVIKDVIRAAKVDMPLAWRIMKAAWTLAVAQMKALWVPLVAFLGEVFRVSWDFTCEFFVNRFKAAMARALAGALRLAPDWLLRIVDPSGIAVAARSATLAALDAVVPVIDSAMTGMVEAARARLQAALERFNYQETDEVRAAREELAKLRALIPEAEARAARGGASVGNNFVQGAKHELKKLDAVLYGSAEAIHRAAEFLEVGRFGRAAAGAAVGAAAGAIANAPIAPAAGAIANAPLAPTAAPAPTPAPAPAPTASAPGMDAVVAKVARTNEILTALGEFLRQRFGTAAPPTVTLEPANV